MSALIERVGLRRFGAILIAIFCIGTAMTLSKPAEARFWVGINFGYPGYYYAPAPSYYYPAYYPYYGYYHRRHWWRHHYRHVHYWRWGHRHWCHWHPYRCYW